MFLRLDQGFPNKWKNDSKILYILNVARKERKLNIKINNILDNNIDLWDKCIYKP